MNLLLYIKTLLFSKDQHFLSVDKKVYKRWKFFIKIAVGFNKNYKSCEIYRKKFKILEEFVVVGLKYSGKNVKRRTCGFAKEFIEKNKGCKCIYCDVNLTNENATADHIIPISNGGNNSQVNLVVCCKNCNSERGNLDFKYYLSKKNIKNMRNFI